VDEAFLRRIQTKIKVDFVTPEQFREIFRRVCQQSGLNYDAAVVDNLIQMIGVEHKEPLRACYPRDIVQQILWGARYLQAAEGRRILGSFNHGSMANALPQAIGAPLAYPDRPVLALSGDGGLAMLLGELLTLAQYELPVKIVIFNNHSLGMVQLEMEVAGLPPYGTERKNFNFAALAQAAGLTAVRVEVPAEVRPALERVLAAKGPALIDVVTDSNVLAMPPKATIQQAKGLALAMTKMAFTGELEDVTDTVMANWRNL